MNLLKANGYMGNRPPHCLPHCLVGGHMHMLKGHEPCQYKDVHGIFQYSLRTTRHLHACLA